MMPASYRPLLPGGDPERQRGEAAETGEVLAEIMATGICHIDAYSLDGLNSEGLFPSLLGHESA